MPDDPAHILNRLECQADFTYTMTVKTIKIHDTGKGLNSVKDASGGSPEKDRGVASRLDCGISHQLPG
jgi:hypothetical protein